MFPQQIKDILNHGTNEQKLALFTFNASHNDDIVLFKFGLWSRYFFPKYFKNKDAEFHKIIDTNFLKAYRGTIKSFTNIVFRGGAKTTRTKLFLVYCLLNDRDHYRKYIKIMSKEATNAVQFVTDTYNMMITHRIKALYPSPFLVESDEKREETKGSYDTSWGGKVRGAPVGTDHRGFVKEENRPDFLIFDDFETSKTLRSLIVTESIWQSMEEAKNGLPVDGSGACVYLCNYISERGNVHKLVEKEDSRNIVSNIPIIDENGNPTWFHSKEYIEQLMQDVDDFAGEYLGKPSAGSDVMGDREILDAMPKRVPKRTIAGIKIFREYDPTHRVASGSDIGGGVGLDHSTNVIIDFDIFPAQVVLTHKSNTIKPDDYGYEIKRCNEYFGECLAGVEKNNHGHATIGTLKRIYPIKKIFETPNKNEDVTNKHKRDYESKEYGWHTNYVTKNKMFRDFFKAVNNGHLLLNDPDLIKEARSYTIHDLMDKDEDPRLTTRHFDLLTGACIAWQMNSYVKSPESKIEEQKRFAQLLENKDFDPYSVV